MRSVLPLLLVACISEGGTFGLSRSSEPANHLVFNNATEPEFLDPTQATGHPDGRIIGELFDGLTEYDPVDLSPRPSHALSWDAHSDGRGYTFHLRDDATWSDGSPVTTADYLWSWEHVLNPVFVARYAQQLYLVDRAPLYNSSRVAVMVEALDALPLGTAVELVDNNIRRLTQDVDVAGVSLREGTVVLMGARQMEGRDIQFRAACPDLSDLPALVGCDGPMLTGTVDEAVLSPEWPLLNARVLTREEILRDDAGGSRLTLAPGQEVVVQRVQADRVKVFHMLSESTGWVSTDALVDPRADLVKATVVQLPPIDWDGAPDPGVEPETPALPEETDGAVSAPAEPTPPLARATVPLRMLRMDPSALGVRARDAHTLDVRLRGVAPYFLQLTSHTTLRAAPRQAWEAHGSRWTRPEHIVTNGPYRLVEHTVRDKFVLEKNEAWWGAHDLSIDRITAYSIDNLHTSANLYRSGMTDFVVSNDIPAEFIPILQDKADFTASPALSVYLYRINTTRPPLNDPRVRRALAMAIDRRDVVKVTKAGQIPANHIVPPGLPYYGDGVPGPDFDPEGARALLAEAGYPGGQGFPEFAILYNTLESHKLVAAVVQEQWKRHLGITVQLENREWKTYLKDLNSLDFDVARGGWIGDFLDPVTFLELWTEGGGNNNTGWSDPKYESLLAQATQEPDPEARAQLLAAAEAMLNEQMPFIPIYWYVWVELTQPDVKGLHPNLLDQHPLRYVTLER